MTPQHDTGNGALWHINASYVVHRLAGTMRRVFSGVKRDLAMPGRAW